MEIWKDIKNFEGIYQVSNMGRIKSIRNMLIRKETISDKGYSVVVLSKNGKLKRKRVHIAVAESFLENNQNKKEVNHIDGNKQNNRVDNLEWNTHSENMKHSYKNGLHKKNRTIYQSGLMNPFIKKVNQYDLQGNYIKTWDGIKIAGQALNILPTSISRCCLGKVRTAGKFIWRHYK